MISPMFFGANRRDLRRAFLLKRKETETEKLMWSRLSEKKLQGFKFRRQHPINSFIVDFYCHKAKLIVEIDGLYHDRPDQKMYDQERTEILKAYGLRELRFSDEDVFNRIDWVITKIQCELFEKT